MFIEFESMIPSDQFYGSFLQRNVFFFIVFSTQYVYLDPYVYCFFKSFHPVRLLGPVRLLSTLE